ncbi:MAG: DNA-binding protein [Candidatus Aenigmatarchaeota archaeon]
MKTKILLDTNFLLAPAQFKVDVFEEMKNFGEPVTLDVCINELKKLSKKKGNIGNEAKVALLLVKKNNLKILKSYKKRADFALMDCAKKLGCTIATNDVKLIKALKNKEIKVIRLRQKKFLTMV